MSIEKIISNILQNSWQRLGNNLELDQRILLRADVFTGASVVIHTLRRKRIVFSLPDVFKSYVEALVYIHGCLSLGEKMV